MREGEGWGRFFLVDWVREVWGELAIELVRWGKVVWGGCGFHKGELSVCGALDVFNELDA